MLGKNTMDFVAIIIALGASVAINRSNIKKHTIEDLQALVDVHEKTIKALKADNAEKDKRICALEETIDEYSRMVSGEHPPGVNGKTGGNSAASAEAAKNRGVR